MSDDLLKQKRDAFDRNGGKRPSPVLFQMFAVSDNILLQSVSPKLTKLREAIVTRLKGLRDAGGEEMRSFEFTLPGWPPLFVKQSDYILVEASTQHFFHLLAIGDKSAPQIPKVIDAFHSEEGYCFMAMERIAAHAEQLPYFRGEGRRVRCLCREAASKPNAFGPSLIFRNDFI